MASPESSPAVEVRVGTDADDPAIAGLLSSCAPGNPKAELDVLRWQYRSEVFGPTVTVVAEAGGELVGHYSAVAVPLVVDGRPVRAMRGVDIVTATEHRGQGVFRRVARHLLDQLRVAGIEVILSTPNDRSLATLLDLGWGAAGDPQVFAIAVDGSALVERSPVPVPAALAELGVRALALRRRGSTSTVSTSVIDGVPVGLDGLCAATTAATGIVRSPEWWRWRYLDHPRRPYRVVSVEEAGQLAGLAAMSLRDDADGRYVQILDLLVTDRRAARALAEAAVEYAQSEGSAAVVAAALPASDHERAVRQAGMLAVPRRLQPRPIHVVVSDLTGTRPRLAARRWAFSLGDQDHL